MTEARWTNPSQPQTLQIAVFLLYINAVFGVIGVLRIGLDTLLDWQPWGLLFLATIAGAALAGRGIASEKKWGYALGVAMAVLPLLLRVLGGSVLGSDIIGLLFEIALVALLLHPMSRDYQRIWFK